VKYILHLSLFLFVVLKLSWAQSTADSSFPSPIKTDTIQKKKIPALKKAPVIHQLVVRDSVQKKKDSASASIVNSFKQGNGNLSYNAVLKLNTYFNFFGNPIVKIYQERKTVGKETLFYLMTGLLFLFAIIKVVFNKYVNNLIGLVFRGSLKQKQIREQLLQTPLPSLLLNIFFIVVAGLYILFLLQYYNFARDVYFWLLFLYCIAAVGAVYLIKFFSLKLTGWIFNMQEAADTYLFIIFMVNKLLGIFLLPLLIVMAFSISSWKSVLMTLSYVLVASFFAYRYIISFAPVRREVKVSQFHFFMYLCAFEVIPLLLIYKVLLRFL
jgi:Domain of unknown function (DUF4271)